jgi:hypothetical protein
MWTKNFKETAMQLSKLNGASAQASLIHKQSALSTDQRAALKVAYTTPATSKTAGDYWV